MNKNFFLNEIIFFSFKAYVVCTSTKILPAVYYTLYQVIVFKNSYVKKKMYEVIIKTQLNVSIIVKSVILNYLSNGQKSNYFC